MRIHADADAYPQHWWQDVVTLSAGGEVLIQRGLEASRGLAADCHL
jgi:hypothetical protein